jgi:hypothetical protein
LETDFGTGRAEREWRQWRPLDQALPVLWQAAIWNGGCQSLDAP